MDREKMVDIIEREFIEPHYCDRRKRAEILLNELIPDGAVVFTREELKTEATFYDVIREQVRKETAREIFSWLRNREPELTDISGLSTDDEYLVSYTVSYGEIKQKAKEYGVEVEE